MKKLMIVLATVAVAGCQTAKPQSISQRMTALDYPASSACSAPYLDDVTITPPSDDVPQAWHGFSGEWTNGLWGGKRCGRISVEKIMPDGSVTYVYSVAKTEKSKEVVFRGTGQIGNDNILNGKFRGGTEGYFTLHGEALRGLFVNDRGKEWTISYIKKEIE